MINFAACKHMERAIPIQVALKLSQNMVGTLAIEKL